MWQKSRGARFPWHFVTYEVCTTHTEVDLKLIFFTQFNNCGILVNCQKILLQYFLTDHIDRLYRQSIVFKVGVFHSNAKDAKFILYFTPQILNFSLEIHLNSVRRWEGASVRKVASWSPSRLCCCCYQNFRSRVQWSQIQDTGYYSSIPKTGSLPILFLSISGMIFIIPFQLLNLGSEFSHPLPECWKWICSLLFLFPNSQKCFPGATAKTWIISFLKPKK